VVVAEVEPLLQVTVPAQPVAVRSVDCPSQIVLSVAETDGAVGAPGSNRLAETAAEGHPPKVTMMLV
jgi:hypothetical protein